MLTSGELPRPERSGTSLLMRAVLITFGSGAPQDMARHAYLSPREVKWLVAFWLALFLSPLWFGPEPRTLAEAWPHIGSGIAIGMVALLGSHWASTRLPHACRAALASGNMLLGSGFLLLCVVAALVVDARTAMVMMLLGVGWLFARVFRLSGYLLAQWEDDAS